MAQFGGRAQITLSVQRPLTMRRLCMAVVLLVLPIAGCGPGKVVLAKGKITNAGKTLLIDRNTSGVILIFHSVKEPGQTYSANFSPADDAYYVYGLEGKGIPAGKY